MFRAQSIGFSAAVLVMAAICSPSAHANGKNADAKNRTKWVGSWTTSPQNAWAGFNGDALVNFAFPFTPANATAGTPASAPPVARNQTLRMIVKPDLWGETMRVRLTNTYGTSALTIGKVAIGLQSFSGATVAGTNTEVKFKGRNFVTIPAGQEMWSDPVKIGWGEALSDDGDVRRLEGRNLAISIYVPGAEGTLTYHNTALQESFLGAPETGDHTMDDDDLSYPYETSVWFLVDAVDVMGFADTRVLVVTGSSSADGSITTPGNNDRFLNFMSRLLHGVYGNHVTVVNEGIGGDVAGVPVTQPQPLPLVLYQRFDRDVLGVSGVTDVLFYAGTNDFGDGIPLDNSIASLKSMVAKLHARGINAIGSTLISNSMQRGTTAETYDNHNAINDFILTSGEFDSTADFYGATIDLSIPLYLGKYPVLAAKYRTHSDPTGTPDFLHLGRAGAEAEAYTLDLGFFAPPNGGHHRH
jgi:hypothetical protein